MTNGAAADDMSRMLAERAAGFPGSLPEEEPAALRAELERICGWLLQRQGDDGLWESRERPNYPYMFYGDAYAVRALLAASRILGEPRYRAAALRWAERYIRMQRSDGGWWVGYGGDPREDPRESRSVVYAADAGETTIALADSYHAARGSPDTEALAESVRAALLRFRDFTDLFRLRSGAIGLGYTDRDFYLRGVRDARRPFIQGHFRPFPFATAVVGVGFQAALYSITGDPADWEKTLASLDWCLEHSFVDASQAPSLQDSTIDLKHLHRVMDRAFACSPATWERAEGASPGHLFRAPERQKLYALWTYVLHLLADAQSDKGEWPVLQEGKELAGYTGALRHRLYFLYSLAVYLGQHPARDRVIEPLARAHDRQLWLCRSPDILAGHYGVAGAANMMPTGLWGMTLCEHIEPGSTLGAHFRPLRAVTKP